MFPWAPLALTASAFSMVAVPLIPAIHELHRRADAAPLPTRSDDGEIRNFAQSFKRLIEPHLPELQNLRSDEVGVVCAEHGQPTILAGSAQALEGRHLSHDSIVLLKSVKFLTSSQLLCDAYIAGDLRGASDMVLRGAYVEGSCELADRSTILRWLHACGAISAAFSCKLHGRVSSDQSIQIAVGSAFERLDAPVTIFGNGGRAPQLLGRSARTSSIDRDVGRMRIDGNFRLGNGDQVRGDVIAAGSVHMGEEVVLLGNVKGKRGIEVGPRSHVNGAAISGKDVVISDGAFVRGPLLAEDELVIGSGVQIGSPDAPTTVSARRIVVGSGTTVYGAVWARTQGEVA